MGQEFKQGMVGKVCPLVLCLGPQLGRLLLPVVFLQGLGVGFLAE